MQSEVSFSDWLHVCNKLLQRDLGTNITHYFYSWTRAYDSGLTPALATLEAMEIGGVV